MQFDLFLQPNIVKLCVARRPRKRLPSPATVITFPLARRRDLVTTAADRISRLRSQNARRTWWRKLIHAERQRMLRLGYTHDAAERELVSFKRAVQAVLNQRTGARRPGGGGAA